MPSTHPGPGSGPLSTRARQTIYIGQGSRPPGAHGSVEETGL